MASKKDPLRKINQRPEIKGGGSVLETAVQIAAPAIGTIPVPIGLIVGSINPARSTQAPMAYVVLDWNQPLNVTPEYYEVEYGKQSDWSGSAFGNPTRVRAYSTDVTLMLDAPADYYARVRAVYRNTVSQYTAVVAIAVPVDTVPPPDFDTYDVAFENGNLVITFGYSGLYPESYKEAKIDIYDATHTTLYAGDIRDATGKYVWTEAANIAASAGAGVTSVSVDITPVSWTNAQGTTVNDTATSVVPNAVANLAYSFDTGDLVIDWDNPTNAPFRLIRVKIYDDNTEAVLYRTIDTVGSSAIWTVDNNFNDTANNPDTDVHVTVQVIGWLNQVSTIEDINAVKAPLASPATVFTTWNADAGIADETITIGWNAVAYAKDYELTINSKVITVGQNTYTYSHAENIADNGGVGDPTLSISVKTRDRLNQLSITPTVNNAVNAPPDDDDFELDYQVGFSSVGGVVNLLTSIHDYKGIHWTLRDATTAIVGEVFTTDTIVVLLNIESGDYTLDAQVKDMYDQLSPALSTPTFTVDALTIEELRQGLAYTDSVGNISSTLDLLKDNEVSSSGVLYTSAHPNFRWTQAEWPLLERIKSITLNTANGTGTPSFYFATSRDGATWNYFAGPITSSRILTAVANEAAAQAATVTESSFTFGSTVRVDFPTIQEVRFVRIYHKTAAGGENYTLHEFFPRRLVQTDDLEVESVKAINVAAGAINANHISVVTLSAVQTSTGTLTIDSGGHIKSGMTAWNTGTGYYFDNNGGTPRFMIGSPTARLYWDGANLVLQGSDLILRTATAVPYTELDSDGIKIVGTLGQYLLSVDAANDKLIFGNWAAQIGEPAGTEGALSFSSGTGGAVGTTQKMQVYNSSSGSPTSGNILSYWHVNRNPSGDAIISGVETGTRAEFVGSNGDIAGVGGRVSTLLIANSTAADAHVYLRAVGTDGTTMLRVSSSGVIRITRSTTTRRAFEDTNDGWLRLNNSGDYSNGVYTPGAFTADKQIRPTGVGVVAYNSSSIALSHNTATTIPLNSERHDSDDFHSTSSNTSRLTVPTGMAGLYIIVGQAVFASNSTGIRQTALRLNGTTVIANMQITAVSGNETEVTVSGVYYLAAGDYVELMAYQNSGGNLDLTANSRSPVLSMTKQ